MITVTAENLVPGMLLSNHAPDDSPIKYWGDRNHPDDGRVLSVMIVDDHIFPHALVIYFHSRAYKQRLKAKNDLNIIYALDEQDLKTAVLLARQKGKT